MGKHCGQRAVPASGQTAGARRCISGRLRGADSLNIQAVNKLPFFCLPACLALLGLFTGTAVHAELLPAPPPPGSLATGLHGDVQRLAFDAAATVWGPLAPAPRIEVVVGTLDPQLKLAPCQQIVPYLPAGARPLGRTRIGLRCAQGATRWNVSLAVQVRVWAPSLVAVTPLPIGTVLQARHLVAAEVDLAERADAAIGQSSAAIGRTLTRNLAAGEALRQGDLKTRVWFNTGDTVRIVAVGPGYAISSEGQAQGPGLDGQTARVRTESGRIVSGIAAGERRIELAL